MAGRFLDYDPNTGLKEIYHKTDKGFAIQTIQDVKPILERNKQLMNDDSGHYRNGNYHHVASIPLVVVEQWRKELGDDPMAKHNRKWLIAKLNDSENKFMRTKGGKL